MAGFVYRCLEDTHGCPKIQWLIIIFPIAVIILDISHFQTHPNVADFRGIGNITISLVRW